MSFKGTREPVTLFIGEMSNAVEVWFGCELVFGWTKRNIGHCPSKHNRSPSAKIPKTYDKHVNIFPDVQQYDEMTCSNGSFCATKMLMGNRVFRTKQGITFKLIIIYYEDFYILLSHYILFQKCRAHHR